MSIYSFRVPNVLKRRQYLLEINPSFALEGPLDQYNMIEARWIDINTGVFIDITTVRPNETARAEGKEGAMKCKDNHKYMVRVSTTDGSEGVWKEVLILRN